MIMMKLSIYAPSFSLFRETEETFQKAKRTPFTMAHRTDDEKRRKRAYARSKDEKETMTKKEKLTEKELVSSPPDGYRKK